MKKSGSNATLVGRHTADYQEEVLQPTHLVVFLADLLRHPQLQPGDRGAVKKFVSKEHPNKEELVTGPVWQCVGPAGKTPVVIFKSEQGYVREDAVFNDETPEDGQRHPRGMETYRVYRGRMHFLVQDSDGTGIIYGLGPGDEIHVFPGTIHQVLHEGGTFLAQVSTDHPLEGSQKEVVDTTALLAGARRHSSAL